MFLAGGEKALICRTKIIAYSIPNSKMEERILRRSGSGK